VPAVRVIQGIEPLIQRTQEAVSGGVGSVQTTMDNLEQIRHRINGVAERIERIGVFASGQASTSSSVTKMMDDTSRGLAMNAAATHEPTASTPSCTASSTEPGFCNRDREREYRWHDSARTFVREHSRHSR